MHPFDERARWLAVHVLPHEHALRSWLTSRPIVGLDVDDIVQETYARLSSAASVENIRDPRSYMFRTAYSVILTHIRRSRVVAMQSFASLESESFIDEQPGPDEITSGRDELMRLANAISQLPPRMRQVFVMRRVEGLPQRAIAQSLGISEKTVEKDMGGCLARLADLLGRGGGCRLGTSRNKRKRADRQNAAGEEPGD